MNANSKTYDIVNGPNRDELIDAFKYAYEIRMPIKFRLAENSLPMDPKILRNLCICEMQHESGTGYNFNLKGYVDVLCQTRYIHHGFDAYYNAKTRSGYIRVTRE